MTEQMSELDKQLEPPIIKCPFCEKELNCYSYDLHGMSDWNRYFIKQTLRYNCECGCEIYNRRKIYYDRSSIEKSI